MTDGLPVKYTAGNIPGISSYPPEEATQPFKPGVFRSGIQRSLEVTIRDTGGYKGRISAEPVQDFPITHEDGASEIYTGWIIQTDEPLTREQMSRLALMQLERVYT
jgi:hypothetical protein